MITNNTMLQNLGAPPADWIATLSKLTVRRLLSLAAGRVDGHRPRGRTSDLDELEISWGCPAWTTPGR